MATEEEIQADLETLESSEPEEAVEGEAEGRRIALEECLHTIATYALELAAGKREAIGAEDIRLAFSQHDVQEIYEEAELFFNDAAELSDLGQEESFEDGSEDDEDDEDWNGNEVEESEDEGDEE